jgi:hypothetical protein
MTSGILVSVVGFREGFRKVEFTKLCREIEGTGLSEAHRKTCAVLDGDAVVVNAPNAASSVEFRKAAVALGAIVED